MLNIKKWLRPEFPPPFPRVWRLILLFLFIPVFLFTAQPVQPVELENQSVVPTDNETYLEELIKEARSMRLWEERLWRLFLHYLPNSLFSGVTSEADGAGFFISPDGKTDPQAELEATLAGFFSTEIIEPGKMTVQCTFPARYEWLNSRLDFDPARLSRLSCERFERWRDSLDPDSVSLVFSSYYFNNPASMFGHTLLVLNKKGRPQEEWLLNYAINYAAVVPSEDNGVTYALMGAFGGYKGYFSIMPYYLKVREYNDMESRDLWEYHLKLTGKQAHRLISHVWELGSTYFDYFFFRENCSYHLLSLLEVADPELRLREDFFLWTLPPDSVRSVLNNSDLLGEIKYRPSRRSQFHQKMDILEEEEQNDVIRIIADADFRVSPEFKKHPPKRQAIILDTAVDFYQMKLMGDYEENQHMKGDIRKLLLTRAKLRTESPHVPNTPKSQPPESGHRTSIMDIGVGATQGESPFLHLGLHPSFHKLLSKEEGYAENSQVSLTSLHLRYEEETNQVRLYKFMIADVISLNPVTRLDTPISWKVNLGWVRNLDGACQDCIPFGMNGGLGLTFQSHLGIREIYFFLLDLQLETKSEFEKSYRGGLGFATGVLIDLGDNWRMALQGGIMEFKNGQRGRIEKAEFHNRFTLSQNLELNLDMLWLNDYREAMFGVGYFF